MRYMRKRLIFFAPLALSAVVLFVFIVGQIVRLLWNSLTPAIFGWSEITFWQALGVLVLCRILFGGLGRHGGPQGPRMDTRGRLADRMADRVASRWQYMTPEERERFRQRFREHFGGHDADSTPVD